MRRNRRGGARAFFAKKSRAAAGWEGGPFAAGALLGDFIFLLRRARCPALDGGRTFSPRERKYQRETRGAALPPTPPSASVASRTTGCAVGFVGAVPLRRCADARGVFWFCLCGWLGLLRWRPDAWENSCLREGDAVFFLLQRARCPALDGGRTFSPRERKYQRETRGAALPPTPPSASVASRTTRCAVGFVGAVPLRRCADARGLFGFCLCGWLGCFAGGPTLAIPCLRGGHLNHNLAMLLRCGRFENKKVGPRARLFYS